MEFTSADAKTLARIQQWRRDVRHFKSEPVSEAILDRLQSAMDCAPSVGNSRPWHVVRVENVDLRAAVRAEFERCNSDAAKAYSDEQRDAYCALKLAGLDAAPVHLAVFTATDPSEGHGLGRRTMPETLRQSTAMAVHALWLAARAENVGVGMVSILDPRRMEALFKMGAEREFSAYLCVGWPAFTDDTPLLHREHWQENTATKWDVR